MQKVKVYRRGWLGYFGIASIKTTVRSWDEWLRRRFRYYIQNGVISEGITELGAHSLAGLQIKTLTLPSTLTRIGDGALAWSDITEIEIPEGVTAIGEYAFTRCYALNSITIPSTLETVGEGAFEWTEIQSVHIPDLESWCNIQFDPFFATPFDEYGGTTLYVGGEPVTDIVIPDGITEIGNSQFSPLNTITSLHIPESVTRINKDAFYMLPQGAGRNSNLKSVTIPVSVTHIGEKAFYECENLERIMILNPDCEILKDAFLFYEYADMTYDAEKEAYIWYDDRFDDTGVWRTAPTVYGYPGSTAEAVATEMKLNFKPLTAYQFLEGTNGEWTLGGVQALSFRADGALEKLWSVAVDGVWVDPANYITESGSTIVSLKADYLNTLKPGTHKLRVEFEDGIAETTFTVKAAQPTETDPTEPEPQPTKPAESDNPPTGETGFVLNAALLALLSMAGVAICLKKRKAF